MSIPTISPSGLAQRCKAGQSCDLIDVRTPLEFREAHVEFARNVPLDQLDPESIMRARNGNSGEPLYVVCQLGGRSQKACEEFHKKGYTNVVNVEGGTQACVAAGLPLVRGKKAISLERQVRIVAGSLALIGRDAWAGWFTRRFMGCRVSSGPVCCSLELAIRAAWECCSPKCRGINKHLTMRL